MTCRHCHEEIAVGQSYFTWQRRYGGPQYLHTTCRRPRPTELSDRKTAQIEEAVLDVVWPDATFDADDLTGCVEAYLSDLQTTVQDVAAVVREVGEEYQASYDNLPENFQYGATGEAMESVAQELESKADDLESWEPDSTEPDYPDEPGDEADEAEREEYVQACETAFSDWASDAQSNAEDAFGDMPEYEG